MNALPDLVRESLVDLTDAAVLPPGLGERAVAAGRRRRQRRKVLVGAAAAVAVAAAVAPVAVLAGRGPTQPAVTFAENAVFAVRHVEHLATSDAESDVHRWEVLDPQTGDYRDVYVKMVSQPTTDLRHAAVIPKGDGAQVPRRIGRYDTTTGAVRWYDVPVRPDETAISPDGRYAMVVEWTGATTIADLAVVELSTGTVTRFDVDHDIGGAEPPTTPAEPDIEAPIPPPPSSFETPAFSWAPDSRHLLLGRLLLDLEGRPAGQLPVPDGTRIVSVNRGDAGTLVHFYGTTGEYAVVDAAGTIRHRTGIDIPCSPSPPVESGCGQRSWPQFLSWRGTDQILVQTGPGSAAGYAAVDLATGEHEAVSPPPVDGDGVRGDYASTFMVVISADGLSPAVRERVAF
jgi:hypothetical protein